MTRRYNKNGPTPSGHGAHQRLAMLTSRRRYEARKYGKTPPLEYLPFHQAITALE